MRGMAAITPAQASPPREIVTYRSLLGIGRERQWEASGRARAYLAASFASRSRRRQPSGHGSEVSESSRERIHDAAAAAGEPWRERERDMCSSPNAYHRFKRHREAIIYRSSSIPSNQGGPHSRSLALVGNVSVGLSRHMEWGSATEEKWSEVRVRFHLLVVLLCWRGLVVVAAASSHLAVSLLRNGRATDS